LLCTRAIDLTLIVLPKFKQSKILILAEILAAIVDALFATENMEPIFTYDLKDKVELIETKLNTEIALPNLPNDLTDMLEPIFKQSNRLALPAFNFPYPVPECTLKPLPSLLKCLTLKVEPIVQKDKTLNSLPSLVDERMEKLEPKLT
jgi:hypothetical protein